MSGPRPSSSALWEGQGDKEVRPGCLSGAGDPALEGSNRGSLLGMAQTSDLAGVFSPQSLSSGSSSVCVRVCVNVWHTCVCIHRDPISCISRLAIP